MKRFVFFGAVIVCLLVSGAFGASGDMGVGTDPLTDGSAEHPFLIKDLTDFDEFAGDSSYWATGVHTKLMTDVDLSGRTYTTAVIAPGTNETIGSIITGIPFSGFFDGNGYSIINLSIVNATDNITVGLFGLVEGDDPLAAISIKNLYLHSAEIHCESSNNVGSIAGRIFKARIDNCHAEEVDVKGDYYVGGLVGRSLFSIVTQCHSKGSVSGKNRVGGLLGQNFLSLTIERQGDNIGQVGEWAFRGSVFACYSDCTVSATEFSAGGLIGHNFGGNVSSCYATGIVKGTYPGGLFGQNVYAMHYYGSIAFCYSTCTFEALYEASGICEQTLFPAYFSYWDDSVGQANRKSVGTDKTTEEMKSAETFSGWGYNGVWVLNEGVDYPRLSWENTEGEPITDMPDFYGGGSGEPNDPFQIWDKDHLNDINKFKNTFNKHFKLMADIDMTDVAYNKIADEGVKFSGTIDGNGHTITVGRTLIGILDDGGLIKDLTLDTSFAERIEQGGKISNCQTINLSAGNSTESFGGIATYNAGEISNCSVRGIIPGEGVFIGGIAGTNDGLISNCTFVSESDEQEIDDATKWDSVGGIAGFNRGTIEYCYSNGNIVGRNRIGGLVGDNDGMILSSYSNGSVTGQDAVGGLVGDNDGEVVCSYSNGSVTGQNTVGGLVGYNYGEVVCCYSSGDVSGNAAGGLVSRNTYGAKILFSYSSSSVSGETIAGLVYVNQESSVFQSFWDVESSGVLVSDGGVGKSTEEMMALDTFKNWGLYDHWVLDENNDYPRLVWEETVGDQIVDPIRTYAGGDGTPENPYQIHTSQQLKMLGNYMDDWDKHYILTSDIVFDPNMENNFDPIGITGIPFSGSFEGNDFTVSNLRYSKDNCDVGLFGFVSNESDDESPPIIRNLNIENSVIISTHDRIGSLAGNVQTGIIENCSVVNGYVKGLSYTGGLIGRCESNLSECSYDGTVNGGDYTGGLVGCLIKSDADNCFATGTVAGSDRVGGLAGTVSGSVISSYYKGSVSGNKYIGGLVGSNGLGALWSCYSSGEVTGMEVVGGLVGSSVNSPKYSYTSSAVTGTTHVGAIAGYQNYLENDFGACYWNIETCQVTDTVGNHPGAFAFSGKTTEEMKQIDIYYKWLPASTWVLDENNDYPKLAWEGTPGTSLRMDTFLGEFAGTSDDPIIIDEALDIYLISHLSDYWSCHYKMVKDIDMSDFNGQGGNLAYEMIRPITSGSYFEDTSFRGCFDGNGHVISNLAVKTDNLVGGGMFGALGTEGVIKNLGLESITVQGYEVTGGLAGYNYGSITNCYVKGIVTGRYDIGGLCGINLGSITGCYSTADISGMGTLGGLVGENSGSVSQCYVTGEISSSGTYCGGLIGRNEGVVQDCYSRAAVTGFENTSGLIGENRNGEVSRCYSVGIVSDGESYLGGLIASYYNGAVINGCFWDCSMYDKPLWELDVRYDDYARTTDEMQNLGIYGFSGWSGDVWTLDVGNDYPRLAWEGADGVAISDKGDGSVGNPYQLSTVLDLLEVNRYEDKSFLLVNDIDMDPNVTGLPVFHDAPIGGYRKFSGIFDGNGHVISNLVVEYIEGVSMDSSYYRYSGLFGYVGINGVVKNLGVENVQIKGNDCDGGLVGFLFQGKIRKCYSTGTVSNHLPNRSGRPGGVGGLVGANYGGVIRACYSMCDVSTANGSYVGGLVGKTFPIGSYVPEIRNCYSGGRVSGDLAGGLLGRDSDGVYFNCFWDSSVNPGLPDCGYDLQAEIYNIDLDTVYGVATDDLKKLSTFTNAGWDFVGESVNGDTDVWQMLVDGSWYPRLAWEFSAGDFVGSDRVDMSDLAYFAGRYGADVDIDQADLDGDGVVGILDLCVFASHWLED